MRKNGDEFDAKKDISRDQAAGPALTFTWVRTVKNGAPNCRLCLRPFGRQSEKSKESHYCPTPGPPKHKMLLVLAAHHGWSVRVFRCQQGFPAHTHENSCVCFATRRASESDSCRCLGNDQNCVWFGGPQADFDEHFGKVAEDLCDESGSLRLARLTAEPAASHSKLTSAMMCKHMDDHRALVGPDEARDKTLTAMGKILLSKTSCPQLGSETKIPRETVDQDGTWISGQATCKTLRQSVVQCLFAAMQSCAFSWCAI